MMFQSWFRPFVSLNTAGKACTLKFSTFSYPSLRKGSIRNISTHSSEVFRSTAIVRSHHNPSVTTQCNLKINPTVHSIFDQNTFTWTYIVYAENHDDRRCAIIDSVLDFDIHSGKTNTTSADRIVDFIQEKKLVVQWILETHIHADHLTASAYLKGKCGGKTGISKHIIEVLNTWVPIFQTSDDTPVDGSQFDKLFDDDETFTVGPFSSQIIHTPGHTPADITYIIEDAMFVGDTMFLPDVGTGRCDFPSGAARQSFASCRRLLQWPEEYRIYVGHDYPPNSARLPHCLSTVGEQKKLNLRVQEGITEEEYVTKRDADDQSRPVPKLLFPAVQVNLRGGKFGKSTGGVQYVKIPINQI